MDVLFVRNWMRGWLYPRTRMPGFEPEAGHNNCGGGHGHAQGCYWLLVVVVLTGVDAGGDDLFGRYYIWFGGRQKMFVVRLGRLVVSCCPRGCAGDGLGDGHRER
ncbi:pollen-specific leucine-rich repeat extensin-like protein 4 [Iris pallida]|uniref:Pollen-specific leucine-rich repeat extensin-like protein 4 n=1 Tax=Iris pallida TaxID=29817 RepID=A0AAX6IAR0_IRIPA|nr:pollen-specific leucine-rich repeat extensin-like protein 4 [Iris pallida]